MACTAGIDFRAVALRCNPANTEEKAGYVRFTDKSSVIYGF